MSNKQRHKQLRKAFNEAVFARDHHACRICGGEENLDAHHITDRHEMPNGGYVLSNGISLCPECHLKAEQFHINEGRAWEPGFHPDDLYKKIGSSKEQACKESENLI